MSKLLFLHIKSCEECPYLEDYDRNSVYCGHPESPRYSEAIINNVYKFPNWCPLTNNEPYDVDEFYNN